MGSVIGYDALCRSPDSHSSHDASRHSTPEHVPKKSDNGISKNYKKHSRFIIINHKIIFLDDCTSLGSMDSSFKVLVTPPVRRTSSSNWYFFFFLLIVLASIARLLAG